MNPFPQTHCVRCEQPFTNPVCESCYMRQLALWFNEWKVHPRSIQYFMRSIRARAVPETSDVFCILCGNKLVSVCTFCFFHRVKETLGPLGLSKEILEDFEDLFNYRLYEGEYQATLPRDEEGHDEILDR